VNSIGSVPYCLNLANESESSSQRLTKLKEREVYKRSRAVAIQCLSAASYRCEYDGSHQLFKSRYTGQPYLEVHHLIPMALQGNFEESLDTAHNVVCLCPRCHRAVHHAASDLAKDLLVQLAAKRTLEEKYAVSAGELLSLYALEDID
jgi:5-methylcytosine-specific restriction protein A